MSGHSSPKAGSLCQISSFCRKRPCPIKPHLCLPTVLHPEVMDHLSHCLNLAPSDPQLFKVLKKELASKQFVKDGNVKQAVTSWL